MKWRAAGLATEAVLDRLFALDQACFHPGIAYTRAELAAFVSHPSAFTVLVEGQPRGLLRARDLLGFAVARSVRHHDRAVLHIITIDVAPDARRQGIGRRLMQWMLTKAKVLGAQAIRLEVSVDNADALAFYARMGFMQVGRIPAYYLDRIDALILERDIKDS